MSNPAESQRARLQAIADNAMRQHGLEPHFPPDVVAETNAIPAAPTGPKSRSATCARCSGARSTTTTRATSTSCRWPRRCRAARQGARRDRRRRRAGAEGLARSIATPRRTRRRSTRRRRSSRCCRSGSRPTSRRSTTTRTGWRWSSRCRGAGRRASTRSDVYGAHGAQPREARLRRRRRLARRRRAAAAGARRPCPGSTSSCACRTASRRRLRRARHEHGALDSRDDRGAGRVRRRHVRDLRPQTHEPREAAHRELHDRGQRRHRALSRRAGLPVAAPRRALARTLGPHRRARGGSWASGCRPSRTRWRSRRFLAPRASGRPGCASPICRSP